MRFSERLQDLEDDYKPTEEDLRQTTQEDEFVAAMMENHSHNCVSCNSSFKCLGDCGYPVCKAC